MAKRLAIANRLLQKSIKAGECRIWLGDTWQDGYPKISYEGKHWRINRLIVTLRDGPIPPGVLVRHTCDRVLCIEEAHLISGSPAQNMQDKVTRNRQSKGDAHRATLRPSRGEHHPRTKRTVADIEDIRNQRKYGVPLRILAEQYSMSISGIHHICTGRAWK